MGLGGKIILAHRFSYETFVGPIPEGLVIDHLCRNTLCVNPKHLEPVTNTTNVMRGESPAALGALRKECIHGHPYSNGNLYIDSRGYRNCRICVKRAVDACRAKSRGERPLLGPDGKPVVLPGGGVGFLGPQTPPALRGAARYGPI